MQETDSAAFLTEWILIDKYRGLLYNKQGYFSQYEKLLLTINNARNSGKDSV